MTSAVDLGNEDRRIPLNRARVLQAAVDLADRDGIDSVSMRRLGQDLGIEAMSLYTHVRGKDDLLDGMVDVVVGEIPIDVEGPDWRTTLRRTILAARRVMLRHRWAARIIETRSAPGPATLRYMEAVTGILLGGGFSVDLTHHAMHVLGSRGPGVQPGPLRRFGRPRPGGRGASSRPSSPASTRTSPRSRWRRATRAASAAATTTTSSRSGSTSSRASSDDVGSETDRSSRWSGSGRFRGLLDSGQPACSHTAPIGRPDELGADLPQAGGRGGVVRGLVGRPGLAVGEVAAGDALDLGRAWPGRRPCRRHVPGCA